MAWQLILGPILGTAGGLAQKWLDSREKKNERAHELAVMDREAEYADRRLKIKQEMKNEEAANRNFSDSYKFANEKLTPDGAKLTRGQLWLTVLVDVFTKAIRPGATTYYQLLVAVLFSWSAWELHRRGLDAVSSETLGTIVSELVFSVIAMAETTLFWWFGIRGMSKRRG